MPLDPSIPLRAVSGRRNSLTDEYAAAVNIKNALAQQKAAEAELTRQENVRNALSGAINPQTGEMDWTKAVNTVATVDPMTALSLKGEMSKERAAGLDMEGKQLELASKRIDALNGILTSITDEQSYQSALRQAESLLGPDAVRGLPPNFDANAQAMVQQAKAQALDFKDRISLAMQDRTFQATEAERRRQAERDRIADIDEGRMPVDSPDVAPANQEYYSWLQTVEPSLNDKFKLPPGSIEAMSEVESGHNPDAVSPTGVRGPMQVTEDTAGRYNLDRNDPAQNVYVGAAEMGRLWEKYNDPELVAAAYNSGEEAVDKAIEWSKSTGAPWTQSGYVRKEGIQHGRKYAAAYQRIQDRLAKGDISPKQAREQTAKLMEKEAEEETALESAPQPMTADEKARYGLPADAPYIMTKEGPKMLETRKGGDTAPVAILGEDGKPVYVPRDEAIGKAPFVPSQAEKPMPASAVKLENELRDMVGTAAALNKDLIALRDKLDQGKLDLGPIENLKSRYKNWRGASDENSRNYETFMRSLEKMRNDTLRLNKGVQTEGDAIRAWNEIIEHPNDEKLVSQRLSEIAVINARAIELKKLEADNVRANFNRDPIDWTEYDSLPTSVHDSGNEPAPVQMPEGVKITRTK